MIALAAVLQQLRLDRSTLEVWIAEGWVRPRRERGAPVFEPIDLARLHLILDLRDQLGVGEEAIPVVLSLLDQLHATRAQMARLRDAIEAAPAERADEVVRRVLRGTRPSD